VQLRTTTYVGECTSGCASYLLVNAMPLLGVESSCCQHPARQEAPGFYCVAPPNKRGATTTQVEKPHSQRRKEAPHTKCRGRDKLPRNLLLLVRAAADASCCRHRAAAAAAAVLPQQQGAGCVLVRQADTQKCDHTISVAAAVARGCRFTHHQHARDGHSTQNSL
jgi:hypothetical protein